tara:strand:+ start:186 stop:1274 length:1089 start_codon:yes stop_codon:yes gene_type:complete
MASTYKNFAANDIATTRTLLHEAIPVTGTIVSGTYGDENIKYFSNGMFTAVYDYPYLSSSANHVFDITAGYFSGSAFQDSSNVQDTKKINVYNQFAQVLVPYDITGNIQAFDQDGDLTGADTGAKMDSCFFVSFARLLAKDEIKKGSFRFQMFAGTPNGAHAADDRDDIENIGDYGAATNYKVNSPTGDYGLLFSSSEDSSDTTKVVGHVYYQAGIAVLTSSIFGTPAGNSATPTMTTASAMSTINTSSVENLLVSGTIDECANAIRFAYYDLDFNNTTELNSTIYFCRANTGDYNFSANPTYLSGSKIRVKNNNPLAEPLSYVTTIGLYSADNELLATAKLSEPLKKSPSNELTLRVRLDY